MGIDSPQTSAEKSPERQQQAAELSRDIQSGFKPGEQIFQAGDHSKVNGELKGFGFPEIQVAENSHLQDHGKEVQNAKYENGNLTYERTGPNGEKQHVTLNMSDHPGLETVQNDKGQVTQTSEADAQGKQHSTDFTYDANGKLTSAKTDGKDILPSDATDAKVDPKTGQLTYQKDGNTVVVDSTGTPANNVLGDQGNKPDIQPAHGDQPAQWTPLDGYPISLPADMDPATAKLEYNHLIYTNQAGNKVDVDSNGRETTTTKDGTQITREHSAGKVTDYHSGDPNGPKCVNGVWSNLPGLSADQQLMNYKPGTVEVDPNTGKVKNYVTDSGVTVTLNDNGKAEKYSSNGYSFELHHDKDDGPNGTWYYHQDGSDNDYVKIDIPTLDEKGVVKTRENGGIDSGRDHELNSGGQKTGSGQYIWSQTFMSGLVRNAGHAILDDNMNTALAPVNKLFGTHFNVAWVDPVNPDHASASEIAGGGIGSAAGFLGIGKLESLADVAQAGQKILSHEVNENNQHDDPSRWQTWYKWWE